MVKCRTRAGTIASLLSRDLARVSQEFLINLPASVLAGGGEARVGSEECECDGSAITQATKSFLEPGACCDDVRI